MAKKLKAELEIETTRAKQRVQEVVDTAGGSAGADVVPSAVEASKALKETAKSTRELGTASKGAAVNMREMVKFFAGAGIGLATSYATSRMEAGSTARTALTYAGNIAAGAVAGSAFGPGGAVAGGAIAAGKTYLDQEAAAKAEAQAKKDLADANLKSIQTWEEARARTQEFRETLESLSKSESGLNEEIKKREAEDRKLADAQRAATGDATRFADVTRARQTNAAEIDALRAAAKAAAAKEQVTAYRASVGAADSLARIGGSMGGGGDIRDLARNSREQLNVLRSIERKTGGATWQ